MAKKLEKIEVRFEGFPPDWDVEMSVDFVISVEEHPEFKMRKGIPVTLTPQEEAQIKNFVKDVVLPQIEL